MKHFPIMLESLIMDRRTPFGVCMGIGACHHPDPMSFDDGMWSCDSCKALVGKVGGIVYTDHSVEMASRMWKEHICQGNHMCYGYVDKVAKPALEVVGKMVAGDAEMICKSVYKICK